MLEYTTSLLYRFLVLFADFGQSELTDFTENHIIYNGHRFRFCTTRQNVYKPKIIYNEKWHASQRKDANRHDFARWCECCKLGNTMLHKHVVVQASKRRFYWDVAEEHYAMFLYAWVTWKASHEQSRATTQWKVSLSFWCAHHLKCQIWYFESILARKCMFLHVFVVFGTTWKI